jgi:hypothetical protein
MFGLADLLTPEVLVTCEGGEASHLSSIDVDPDVPLWTREVAVEVDIDTLRRVLQEAQDEIVSQRGDTNYGLREPCIVFRIVFRISLEEDMLQSL